MDFKAKSLEYFLQVRDEFQILRGLVHRTSVTGMTWLCLLCKGELDSDLWVHWVY